MASVNYLPPPHFILHNILLAEEQHISNLEKGENTHILEPNTRILEKYMKKKVQPVNSGNVTTVI